MSLGEQRMAMIREKLEAAFAPDSLAITDDSHLHAGHASAGGAGHFNVHIVSMAFEGKSVVQRHQMIYQALGELMNTEVHALGIQADTPQ